MGEDKPMWKSLWFWGADLADKLNQYESEGYVPAYILPAHSENVEAYRVVFKRCV